MSESKIVDVVKAEDEQPENDLTDSIKRYLVSGEFSDLTITTKDKEFKVHRLVVCGQSKFFAQLYRGDWTEKNEKAVFFREDDSFAIEAMIHHMYGFDYSSSGSDRSRVSPMLFNVKVYHIADKYDVPQLKEVAKKKFKTAAKACWQMDDFPVAITEVYSGTLKTDRGLREPLVTISTEHIDQLQEEDGFRSALESTAGFAMDLALNLAQRNAQTKYRCPSCTTKWVLGCIGGKMQFCPNCGNSRSNWSTYIVRD